MNTAVHWPPETEYDDEIPSLRERAITLIAKSGTGLVYAINIGDKRDLLQSTRGRVWAVWTGRWSSNLYEVPRAMAVKQVES